MANNCYNWVSITGEKDALDLLQTKLATYDSHEGTFSDWCDTFFTNKRIINEDSYEENYYYGTKWWDFEVERNADDDLLINGDSAWSPPQEFLRRLSEEYAVFIRGEYEESGSDFGGYAEYEKGVMDDYCYTYREWMYINNEEQFFNELEYEVEYYDTFEDYKAEILDKFENALTEQQIAEVREDFERQQDELKKRKNDQISLA
jgi:hypothetical protein